jgi:hypothetical protein
MATKKIGQRVVITHGMSEFVGKTGEIVDNGERDGSTVMYRVRLYQQVEIPGVGTVTDDLWSGAFLRNVHTPKSGAGWRSEPLNKDFYSDGSPVEGREPNEIMAANDADLIL